MKYFLLRLGRCLAGVLLVCLCVTGCRTGYDITLNNGVKVTSANKPKLDPSQGVFRYKDPNGEWKAVPAFRVQSIEPR